MCKKAKKDYKKGKKFSSLKFNINEKPFSANKMYTGRKRRSVWYKAFEKAMMKQLPEVEVSQYKGYMQVHIIIGVSTILFDQDNACKPILDVLQKRYGFNDNKIFYMTVKKMLVNKGDEFINVDLKKYKGHVDLTRKK